MNRRDAIRGAVGTVLAPIAMLLTSKEKEESTSSANLKIKFPGGVCVSGESWEMISWEVRKAPKEQFIMSVCVRPRPPA